MDMIPLTAAVRDPKVNPRVLRRQGQVPCVVYGHEARNMTVQCKESELHRAFAKAGESTLVSLEISGEKTPVLFKDVSFDPVSDREVHVDFYAVNMKEEIEASVPVHFEGVSPAVKDQAGVLVTPHDHVKVRCLPADLPHALTVSIESLVEFHDVVKVSDLKLPKGVKVMDAVETVLATVQEPREEEVIAPTPTEAAALEGAAAVTAEGAPAAAGAEGAAAAPEEAKGKKEKK